MTTSSCWQQRHSYPKLSILVSFVFLFAYTKNDNNHPPNFFIDLFPNKRTHTKKEKKMSAKYSGRLYNATPKVDYQMDFTYAPNMCPVGPCRYKNGYMNPDNCITACSPNTVPYAVLNEFWENYLQSQFEPLYTTDTDNPDPASEYIMRMSSPPFLRGGPTFV